MGRQSLQCHTNVTAETCYVAMQDLTLVVTLVVRGADPRGVDRSTIRLVPVDASRDRFRFNHD